MTIQPELLRSATALPSSTKQPTVADGFRRLLPRMKGRHALRDDSTPPPTPTSIVSQDHLLAHRDSAIPLWDQCGLALIAEPCAGDARCICKDEWWSQCRILINGSWFPTGEVWICNRSEPLGTVSSSPASRPTASASPSQRIEDISPVTSRGQPTGAANNTAPAPDPSVNRPSSHPTSADGAALSLIPPNLNISLKNSAAPSTNPSPSFHTSVYARPFVISASARPLYNSSNTWATTSGPSSTSSSTEDLLHTSVYTKPFTISALALPSDNSSNTWATTSGPSSTSSSTEDLLHTSVYAKSFIISASALPLNISSTALATTSRSSSSSSSTEDLLHASAYANPFVIPVSPRPSKTSPEALATTSPPSSLSSSTETAIDQPKASSSSRLPDLACPANSAAVDVSSPQAANHVGEQACNPNTPANTANHSASDSSSTLVKPGTTDTNPEKFGTYLEANATSDQQSHCLNFAAHQYQICWEILNLTGYIQDWVAFNQHKCNDEDMGFADCFLYLEIGAGSNCASFTGRSQCPSPDAATFTGRTHGAQVYYVAFNIWNIQNWFFTYYMAIEGANGLTADNVDTIARTLNLPPPKTFPILDLLAGLAFAFGLISPSGYGALIPKLGAKVAGFSAQTPGEYLLRAVQNSPTLSRNLVAQGNLGDSGVQIAELSSGLARIVSQLQNNVQNSIVLVMSNFSVFFDFVQDGFFSAQIENLNTLTQNVTLSLNTYIVSQALQNDKVIITRALNTDVNELQLNGSAYQYNTGCGHGYDEWGMCANWWYDSSHRISYGLESQKDMLNNYTTPLESLFNQGITTPELLFLNSQLCADAAASNQGNAPGTTLSTTTGTWNTECISNMQICTWDTVNMGVEHEYTDCKRESAFAMEGCGAGTDIQQAVVPASYIGPWLTGQEFNGIVCNSWGKGMGSPG